MSITPETAKAHAKDPAVCCCRFEAGTVIETSNLEDPAIFADLEDSGLLEISADCLTIEEVLGAKLTKTVDALTPLTADLLEGVNKVEKAEEVKEEAAEEVAPVEAIAPVSAVAPVAGGSVKIHIGEGRNIDLEIPLNVAASMGLAPAAAPVAQAAQEVVAPVAEVKEAKAVRSLAKKHFKIEKVELADETKIEGTTLYIRKDVCPEAIASQELVVDMKLEIITPDKYNTYSETIMDVQPIATKEEGELGSGVTRIIDGVIVMVTGTDENGVQIGEFGSSEGDLDKNIMWGRPGAPDKGDIFIKTQVTVKAGMNMERPGPLAAHMATDVITQEIREALKTADESLVVETEELTQYRRPGKKKVVIVKEIMGQGAMHDNLILPMEPVGTLGAKPNVDLGNVPVMLSPLEVLDGGIHALTCIGPASKENSRHYYREPLVIEAMNDEEIDLAGVIFVGSPQVNSEKFYVSNRLGMIVEAMDVDGAIITTEGFGNNHIDFASHHEQIGKRGVAVVGCTFSAVQGALVVGNKYMTNMIDNNKSKQGIENEILSNNTLCKEDAVRALAMVKAVMGGEEVKAAERKWNSNVKLNNVELIEKETGLKVELLENEQSLELSKKRREIYEK
ncbi:D-proline reductase (dithiol) proprotein PrdA [Tepidibacter hydrothermalis]|uniref:D-proline reductase (Dithiol) proprotein PrdA n=1 Tax=Tepidibacter hydrothermalis TaxID=3036126 RepID=A0ABY8EJQ7_9FIRM|nr:D-proline reductase (dithiol) proprotein PrdA [Tepidibacter hydrothermalis]WFD11233.1 D-proline reductase (dithiol) proprotein PrdA [Tepidibacter hydrothermalis]